MFLTYRPAFVIALLPKVEREFRAATCIWIDKRGEARRGETRWGDAAVPYAKAIFNVGHDADRIRRAETRRSSSLSLLFFSAARITLFAFDGAGVDPKQLTADGICKA